MRKDSELISLWTPCCQRRVRGVVLIEAKESHRRLCPKCKVEYDVGVKVLTDTSVQMDWWPVAEVAVNRRKIGTGQIAG